MIWEILFAPLFYILPLGVGLFLFSLGNIRQKSVEYGVSHLVILIGLFAGLHFNAVFFSLLEHLNLLQENYKIATVTILTLSVLGIWRWKSIVWHGQFFRKAWATIGFVLPVVCLFYYVSYFATSEFPLRDIFQDVHFLKGAVELSKYRILNPFVGDTYIPLIQTHLALLNTLFGLDIFRLQWILPFFSILLHSLCFLTLIFEFLKPNSPESRLAYAISIVSTLSLLTYNNNNLMMTMMIVSLAFVWRMEAFSRRMPLHLGVSVVLFVLLWYLKLPFWGYFWVWAMVIPFFVFATQFAFVPLILLTIVFVGFGYHRAFLVGLGVLIALFITRRLASKHYERIMLLLVAVPIFVFFIPLLKFAPGNILETLEGFILPIMSFVLKSSIDARDKFAIGGGALNALTEYIRLVPIFFHLLLSVLFLSFAKKFFLKELREEEAKPVLVLGALYLTGLVLVVSPLPFWYRALTFPVLLASIGFSKLFFSVVVPNSDFQRSISLWTLVYLVIAFLPVLNTLVADNPRFPYLTHFYPVLGILGISIVLLGFVRPFIRVPRSVTLTTCAIVLLGLSFDRIVFAGMFFNGSYGRRNPAPQVISHYSLSEFESLDLLSPQADLRTIFLSDGPMMSLAKARLGISPFVTFSNIDLINPNYVEPLARILIALNDGNEEQVEKSLRDFSNQFRGSAPEARYVYEQRMGIKFDLKNYRDKLVFCLTPRAVGWARQVLQKNSKLTEYFPSSEQFSPKTLARIRRRYDVIADTNNEVLIFKSRELRRAYGSL